MNGQQSTVNGFNMMDLPWNSSILCVDDEPGIIDAYRNTLKPREESSGAVQGLLSQRRERRKGGQSECARERKRISYELFTASSGEEAVEIVRKELAEGRRIAAGFFDMAMPGGIDGGETIRRIIEIDRQMLCAVVTAYTDRSPDQIGTIFARQDDWLYFNKPFSAGEVRQTAYHMVTAWNQRRREQLLVSNLEMMQNGLLSILQSVNDINQTSSLMLDVLLEGILDHFLKLAGGTDGFLYIKDSDREPLHLARGYFETAGISRKGDSFWSMAEEAMQKRTTVISGNTAATALVVGEFMLGALLVQKNRPVTQDPKLFDIYSLQAVNIIRHSTLYNELEYRNLELDNKNQELVSILGKLTETEKLRTQFEELSYIDALTGIPNRRSLDIRLGEEISRSRRYGFSLACLMLDIDYFKRVNDTYGHAAGDYVLTEIGNLLLKNKRPYDLVGRYGGEEFVFIAKQTDPEGRGATTIAERIRSAVEKHVFSFEGKELKVTISIGISVISDFSGEPLHLLLKKADDALYTAKSRGRNQYVLST
ncbi:MAG: diguanylate cyclase [Pseudomonadota bacterium]